MKSKLTQIYLPRVFTALFIVLFAIFMHFSFNQNTHEKWLSHTDSYSKTSEIAFTNWVNEESKNIEGLASKPELSEFMSEPTKEPSINGIKILLKQFSYITGLKNIYTFSALNTENPVTSIESAMPIPKDIQEALKKVAAQEKEHLFLITHIGNSPYFIIGQIVTTDLGTATGYAFYLTPAEPLLSSLQEKVFSLAHSKDMHFQIHQYLNEEHLSTLSFEDSVIHTHKFDTLYNSPLHDDLVSKPGIFAIKGHGSTLLKTTKSKNMNHIAFSAFISESALSVYSKTSKIVTWAIAIILSIAIIFWPGKGPIEYITDLIVNQQSQRTKTLGSESRGSNAPASKKSAKKLQPTQKSPPPPSKGSPDEKASEYLVAYNIRTALQDQRFTLLYQPIVDTKTNLPIMYEVFSRIIDENGAVITPDIFMPVAHKENIVHLIDQGAIHTVFDKHLKLSTQGLPVPLSVNLSGDTFESIAFLESFMKKITGKNEALSKKIVFELNSKEIIEDKHVMKFIRECHAMGVRFAFDYFGGGANTIKAAKALKLDFVKVNAFHFPITDKEKLKELIIIAKTAKEVGIPIIAERVEDPHFIAFCQKVGITLIQGFGIAKPSANPTYRPAA